jgi:hypothetical protein
MAKKSSKKPGARSTVKAVRKASTKAGAKRRPAKPARRSTGKVAQVGTIANERFAFLVKLFDEYGKTPTPATGKSLNAFIKRASEREVPEEVVAELSSFYSFANNVPLGVHPCDDLVIFEWWDDDHQLWLGQRDFYTLRWADGRYCVGDAGDVSLSPADEFGTFAEAIERILPPEFRGPTVG